MGQFGSSSSSSSPMAFWAFSSSSSLDFATAERRREARGEVIYLALGWKEEEKGSEIGGGGGKGEDKGK